MNYLSCPGCGSVQSVRLSFELVDWHPRTHAQELELVDTLPCTLRYTITNEDEVDAWRTLHLGMCRVEPTAVKRPADDGLVKARHCPDGDVCHHTCQPSSCWRVDTCGPLSGVYPGDVWPTSIIHTYVTAEFEQARKELAERFAHADLIRADALAEVVEAEHPKHKRHLLPWRRTRL